jgi:lipopolysaccharide export system protein LptA
MGKPATIKSNTIDGEAEVFVIYPNKLMNLIGNAKLLNNSNSITSNLITYQISQNE